MKQENNTFKKSIVKKSYKVVSIITAFISASALWYYNISPYWEEGYEGYMTLFLVGIMFCVTYWIFAKMYQAQKIGIYRLTELTYFQLLAFAIADVILIVESVIWFHGFAKLRIGTFIVGFVLQMMVIVFNIFVHNRLFARYDEARKVLIIYGNDGYNSLIKKMKAKKYRYNILGCYSDTTPINELEQYIAECESVYLYEANEDVKRQLVFHCDHIGKDIVKRTIDIVCAGAGLIVLSPVFLITAICIKAYDKGPVFYKQVRLTKDHKEFEIYKFRSMIINAETDQARLASQHDDRITPVGKRIRALRIDELPQLINILKGDMTIVGPRPERPEIEKIYLEELPEFGLRLKVKAGLTGYAQVFGKYNTTPEDKLKLDLLYINQRSLLLDFKLIFYTIKIIFVPEATEGIDDDKKTAGHQ